MADPRRILIIRPSALGDVCRTVPVLVSLRKAFPQARLEWVVQDDFAEAVAAHPMLDELIPFPRAGFARWWRPNVAWHMIGWLRDLARREYDLVLDCQGLSRSGLMTIASGAPQRVGLRTAREFAWIGYNRRVPVRATRNGHHTLHTVDQMLLLAQAVGAAAVPDMHLYVPPASQAWWDHWQDICGLRPGAYAVLAPTARWPSKRWPIERFAKLVAPLHARGLSKVLLIGGPSEAAQVAGLLERCPPLAISPDRRLDADTRGVIDLAGGTSIGQTMAVIAHAGLVIANDSAPLHMAVGFDRPCVGLFGPTDPDVVGPYGRPEAIVRAPQLDGSADFKDPELGDALMRRISVAQVIDRIEAVLSCAPLRKGSMARAARTDATQPTGKRGAQAC